jgi:hypothetical protein
MPPKTKRFVVVTTAHRGVFGGYLNGQDETDKTVTLTEAHMCIYWPTEVHGVLGLATTGPLKGSRISPAVPKIVLQDVTSVMDATSDAEKAWQTRLWS